MESGLTRGLCRFKIINKDNDKVVERTRSLCSTITTSRKAGTHRESSPGRELRPYRADTSRAHVLKVRHAEPLRVRERLGGMNADAGSASTVESSRAVKYVSSIFCNTCTRVLVVHILQVFKK